MRVLLAGATGAIGRPLLPMLIAAGHDVHATTRSTERAAELESAGATAEVVDFLRPGTAEKLVRRVQPDVIVDQLTSLPEDFDPRKPESAYAANDAIRFEGTGALIRAAEDHDVRRYVGQSIAFLYKSGRGEIRTEADAVWADAPQPFGRSIEIATLNEQKITKSDKFTGVVLRFGALYGPGTWYASDGSTCQSIRKRQLPLVGGGAGMTSVVHVSDAATAAALAVVKGQGIYNIVDDEPAPFSQLVPYVADLLGAKRPRKVPAWIARRVVGDFLTTAATAQAGASNAKAKEELDWSPIIPSWRDGMRDYRDSLPTAG